MLSARCGTCCPRRRPAEPRFAPERLAAAGALGCCGHCAAQKELVGRVPRGGGTVEMQEKKVKCPQSPSAKLNGFVESALHSPARHVTRWIKKNE